MSTNRFSGIFQASGRQPQVPESPEASQPQSPSKPKAKSKRRKGRKGKAKKAAPKSRSEVSNAPPPAPAKSSNPDYQRTTIYIPKELHRQLKLKSAEKGLEMSDVFTSLLKQWLETPDLDPAEAIYALAHPYILPDPPPKNRIQPATPPKRSARKSTSKDPIAPPDPHPKVSAPEPKSPVRMAQPQPEPPSESPQSSPVSPRSDSVAVVSRLANRAKLAAARRKRP